MPRPTPPVKRVCYADNITVWATGPTIPQLESMINSYMREVRIYLKDNSLLISAPKSTVTLYTPDKHQFQMHYDITLGNTQLPLECSHKILGVIMDPSLSFHKHCNYVSDRMDKSHGITLQEPRPRPMKETLHSRHQSTVLSRLGPIRMESHQNMHTHAVDSAIQLQGNTRVLKKRPPPISDEEQRLNRRQRCTLSQLRSGHCHLLQDYKHRVLGEPRDICTYCGASPQDVRHLLACTKHPTDLSPEDLWRNPVGSIRAFSYIDNGNLD